MLDHFLSFKGEPNKIKNKVVENNLYLIAHNGSGFDRSVVLNNLPQWRSVVKLIKNGAGIFSLKLFNGFVDAEKKMEHDENYEDTWEEKRKRMVTLC